jgi:flagellar motor protein MotB
VADKKCKCPEEEGGGDFMTTFADMVTLLLCFFSPRIKS